MMAMMTVLTMTARWRLLRQIFSANGVAVYSDSRFISQRAGKLALSIQLVK